MFEMPANGISLCKRFIQPSNLFLRQAPARRPTVFNGAVDAIRFRNGNNVGTRDAPIQRDSAQCFFNLRRNLLQHPRALATSKQ